jgi:hypothetical protein
MALYCTCDAPQYSEAVNVCRRCLRPVIEATVWADSHPQRTTIKGGTMHHGGHFPDSPNVPTVPARKLAATALIALALAAAIPTAAAASLSQRPNGGHCC